MSTELTFSVEFVYLEHDIESNFIWAQMNIIEVIFSSLVHLLCVFHVVKNVGAKFNEFVKINRQ